MKRSPAFLVAPAAEEHGQASILEPITLAAYTVKDLDHVMAVINESYESFDVINDYISSTITLALTRDAENITKVTEEAWQKALFTRGLYVDYGVAYNTATFSQGARRRGISAFRACADAAADYYHCGGQPFQHSVGVCNGRSGADVL